MKLTPWYLAALAPLAIAGCSNALIGHVAVLAVAVGIFVGTLSLGRQQASSSTEDVWSGQLLVTSAPEVVSVMGTPPGTIEARPAIPPTGKIEGHPHETIDNG